MLVINPVSRAPGFESKSDLLPQSQELVAIHYKGGSLDGKSGSTAIQVALGFRRSRQYLSCSLRRAPLLFPMAGLVLPFD